MYMTLDYLIIKWREGTKLLDYCHTLLNLLFNRLHYDSMERGNDTL